MKINFHKYQGTGNDFIIIDNRDLNLDLNETTISSLCSRRKNIGADGLILLENDDDKKVDFKMRYYNSDGREASLCGNGGRCITVFAKELGIIENKASFSAFDGNHSALILKNKNIKLKIRDIELSSIIKNQNVYILDTGSPHYVTFIEDLENIDSLVEGRKIRYSNHYSENGINVNFAQIKDNEIWLETYERGVENVTLSCGTGNVATALAFSLYKNYSKGPIRIINNGGVLLVHFKKSKTHFTDIYLEGEVEKVFEGEFVIP